MSWSTRTRSSVARVGAVVAVAASALGAQAAPASAADACPATPDKCYTFTLSSAPAAPTIGQAATYTATLTNASRTGTGVRLGSVNLTLPSSFYGVTAGSASVGTETANGSVIALRGLSLSPGGAVTATFSARNNLAGSYPVASQAKQANDFNGTGNDLTLTGSGSPVIVVSSGCAVVPSYNSCGANVINKATGGSTTSGAVASDGSPAQVRATITYGPILAQGTFVSQLYTSVGDNLCPVVASGKCDFVVTVANKIPGDYTIANNAITLDVACGALCGGAGTLWFQLNEATGVQEPLLPCTPASAAVPSPLSGSYACIDGTTVRNITSINDWKVMGVAVG